MKILLVKDEAKRRVYPFIALRTFRGKISGSSRCGISILIYDCDFAFALPVCLT